MLFYQSVTLDYINILIIFIFNFSFFFWLYLIVKYILKYIKIYRPYFFYKESNVLIQNRKYFRKFANITFVIFILNIILLIIYISINWIFNLVWFINILLLSALLYLMYKIFMRLMHLEIDLIVFDDYWIRKFVNDSLRFNAAFYLSKLEIWNIYVSNTWFFNLLFKTWTITVVNNELVKRHFEYISKPDDIYKMILKLVESRK